MRVSSIFPVLLGLSVMLANSQSFAQSPPAPPVLISNSQPQCSDGIDNDGDGKIDFSPNITSTTGDDGCWDPSDDDERAGLPAGTALVTTGECASANLTIAGNTYNNCNFPDGSGVKIQAPNITITDSRIRGKMECFGSNCATLVVQDTDAIGNLQANPNALIGSDNSAGVTFRRVRATRYPQTWYTDSTITVEDSVSKNSYGNQSDCHMEPVLANQYGSGFIGGTMLITRTRLSANYDASNACTGGGFSTVVAIYGNAGSWGPAKNKRFVNNRFESNAAGISSCLYGGQPQLNTTGENIDIIGNVWGGVCNDPGKISLYWLRGLPGSEWSGNVRGDSRATGTPIAEP